jgi:putative glutathione S-transferase
MSRGAQFPKEQTTDGEFKRQDDAFRDWVTADRRSGYPEERERYHLYVSWACPWAHRTIIMRTLKRLEDIVGMTAVDPIRDDRGWAFRQGSGYSIDPINGFQFLSEAYQATNVTYQGRVTVPVLWDTKTGRIVSNSDDDIMRMFNHEFEQFTDSKTDFYPQPLQKDIDELNQFVYETINNGVYRAGFATSQRAYEGSVRRLFQALDTLESRLTHQRYLFGERLVETDWRLFVTLIRFDAVYYGHFKCNLQRIVDYPNLWGYLRDLYQYDDISTTVNFDHIKRHYYITHDHLNPTGIVPLGPDLDLDSNPGRSHLKNDYR